jgi:hypothetical protein
MRTTSILANKKQWQLLDSGAVGCGSEYGNTGGLLGLHEYLTTKGDNLQTGELVTMGDLLTIGDWNSLAAAFCC